MAEPTRTAKGVKDPVELGGYKPELKRTLGSFQMFAISFAFISVAVGIFATYDVVLQTGGPVSIWLWVLAAAGQILVALVYAQFASRIPLSGSAYQWGSRLANPKIGFGLGWLTVCYLAIGVVATDNALAKTAFMPLFNIQPNELTARLITLVLLLIEVVVVVASTRLASMINSSAVALELAIIVGFSIALIVAVVVTGHGSEGNLLSRGVAPRTDYFAIGGGLMDAMILGLATLVGFDSAANLAEEAKDPFRSVPRAIVGSVVAAGLLGLIFLVALTVAIKSIPRITDSDSPIALIIRDHFGSGTERVFLVAITLAFFGAAIAVMTACSRLVFAMSRDARFPAHRLMRRVNQRTHTPIPATVLIFVVGIVLMAALPGSALLKLIISGTIIMPIIYGATIVLYLVVRKRLNRREGAFNLGRFELPVAISALVWVVCALFVITVPKEAIVPDLIVVGLMVAGGLYFLVLFIFHREVLETEPGVPTSCWIDPRVSVGRSMIEGRGLLASAPLPEGTVVMRLGGRLVSAAELSALMEAADADPAAPYVDTITVEDDTHLIIPPGEQVHFGNHSCNPNLWHEDAFTLVVRRAVTAEDELTLDYATQTADPQWRMDCRCGDPSCRQVITGEDWRRPELQDRYGAHFVPGLLARMGRVG